MSGSAVFRLLVVLLGLSHLLVSLHAVPTTRSSGLLQGHQASYIMDNVHLVTMEESFGKQFLHGRMDMELNDYPGSGANNRHTPRGG